MTLSQLSKGDAQVAPAQAQLFETDFARFPENCQFNEYPFGWVSSMFYTSNKHKVK